MDRRLQYVVAVTALIAVAGVFFIHNSSGPFTCLYGPATNLREPDTTGGINPMLASATSGLESILIHLAVETSTFRLFLQQFSRLQSSEFSGSGVLRC